MRYDIVSCLKYGNDVIPCYEATILESPNLLESFFGAKEKYTKWFSDYGFLWYNIETFVETKNKKLLKTLNEITDKERRGRTRKFYDQLRELKVVKITEQSKSLN
ncbi:hypothetical protein HYV49_05170 [Candidatus Pacearchaeota archaeon]|nr:hypothetical protein [Candidatus Pacearchaeota archaeon]